MGSELQALKAVGVTEVILAINYQPEVRSGSCWAELCPGDSLHTAATDKLPCCRS